MFHSLIDSSNVSDCVSIYICVFVSYTHSASQNGRSQNSRSSCVTIVCFMFLSEQLSSLLLILVVCRGTLLRLYRGVEVPFFYSEAYKDGVVYIELWVTSCL